jgi:hypothetical protein
MMVVNEHLLPAWYDMKIPVLLNIRFDSDIKDTIGALAKY